jgi:hypothetical protein
MSGKSFEEMGGSSRQRATTCSTGPSQDSSACSQERCEVALPSNVHSAVVQLLKAREALGEAEKRERAAWPGPSCRSRGEGPAGYGAVLRTSGWLPDVILNA